MKEYIERAHLLEVINEVWERKYARCGLDYKVLYDLYRMIIRRINRAPAEDVIPAKHGTWETVHGVLTPGGDPLKRCPFCRSRESEHLDGVEHYCHWNFCPTCGAKMDGGKE